MPNTLRKFGYDKKACNAMVAVPHWRSWRDEAHDAFKCLSSKSCVTDDENNSMHNGLTVVLNGDAFCSLDCFLDFEGEFFLFFFGDIFVESLFGLVSTSERECTLKPYVNGDSEFAVAIVTNLNS